MQNKFIKIKETIINISNIFMVEKSYDNDKCFTVFYLDHNPKMRYFSNFVFNSKAEADAAFLEIQKQLLNN